MRSLGKRASPVQFRVEAHFIFDLGFMIFDLDGAHGYTVHRENPRPYLRTTQSSQRSGRFHTPAVPGAALGTATILSDASPQQSAGFLRKKAGPGQHRREAPFNLLA